MRFVYALFSAFSLFLSNGCTVGPDYQRPKTPLPKTLTPHLSKKLEKQKITLAKRIPKQWWEAFHSDALNKLILESFQHNADVGAAKAALLNAREQVYAHRGVYFPHVDLSFEPSKQQVARILTSVLASNQYDYALFTGQLFVGYNPDVFGGNKRQEESLIAQAHYQQLKLEATYLTLASNVVSTAIQEASFKAQIKETKHLISTQKELLDITRQRKRLGDASEYDLHSEEAALAATEATLPSLRKQLAFQRDLLRALAGRLPDDRSTPDFKLKDIKLPKNLPLSLPSTLLEQRPDIRAAEEQMHSANALIGVAKSNRLPNINLTTTGIGAASTTLTSFVGPNTNFWGLAGILTQPIFDSGTLLHRQKAAEAAYQEAAETYRSTVIQAFQNVTDTLNAISEDSRAYTTAQSARQAAKNNASIARHQWQLGDLNTYILLQNEQNYLQARIAFIQSETNRLLDSVALFQALGGGWWDSKISSCTAEKNCTHCPDPLVNG
jgi:NodT family efflux transporter outer membrane factor (OMF) lipoprotein